MPAPCLPFDLDDPARASLTRRRLVSGSAAALAVAGGSAMAQEASLVAVDPEAFRKLCLALTGAGQLDDDGLEELLGLLLADEQMSGPLEVLLASEIGPDFDVWEFDFDVVIVINNILQYWYLGTFRNEPLADRESRVGRLVSYAALPYFTAPGVCKAFGYWATDPGIS